ncbi:MAG: alpha/beta hydrolase [Phycisphaerales bacterium]|nr:alpha/beta hydrolase [Phycisphaerales bacterium]
MSTTTKSKDAESWKAWTRRKVVRWVKVLGVLYVAMLLGTCMVQEKLIFPGGWMTQGKPEAVVQPMGDTELVELRTASGEKVFVHYGVALTSGGKRREDAVTCPTILYFYGNAMCLNSTAWEMESFRRLGANVAIAEYVGFGMAEGKPSEKGCYETADAALMWLEQRGVPQEKVIAVGWSLGAAVACDTAGRYELGGLVICSGFSSLDAWARQKYWFFPTGWMLRHHFRSVAKIGRAHGPILIVHGTHDTLIPYQMSLDLQAAAEKAGRKVTHLAISSGHNDLYQAGNAEILRAMEQVVQEVRGK